MPDPPPWSFSQVGHRGELCGLASDEFAINFSAEHCLLVMYHRPTRRAVYWVPRAENLPYWEMAAPFRTVFHWWSSSFDGQLTHAAVVGKSGRGVLLVGRGGSGKSTTALLSVEAGLDYIGDDYVLLTGDPEPAAHSLYSSAKMHTAFLGQALPAWRRQVATEIGPEKKSLFFLHETRPEQIRRQLRIAAIVQPQVTTRPVAQWQSRRALDALLAAGPSTMYQLPDARQGTLSFLARLAAGLPTKTLLLGQNLGSGPARIAEWLDDERKCRAA
jgi:hypothetical protein